MPRFLSLAVLFLLVSCAVAQPPGVPLPSPRITSVFPMGAKVGSTVEVTVTGTDLDEAAGLVFSHPGFKATVIVVPEPKPDPKAKAPPKKGPPPTAVKFAVVVDKSVPVGRYDVRVVNKFGLSNPRLFTVGLLDEVNEVEPDDEANSEVASYAVAGSVANITPKNTARAQRVSLNTTINGIINSPTDVDYSVFSGAAKSRVLISCVTSGIDSRARPLVEVFDAAGRRIGLNRNAEENDALCDVTLPRDGDYFVRVSEFAYQQGGPDYFYRLTLSTGPWIDAIYPAVVNPGSTTAVTVYGRNLPGGKVVPGVLMDGQPIESLATNITAPKDAMQFNFSGRISPVLGLMEAFEFRLPGSNAVPVFLSDGKLVLEKATPNDKVTEAEELAVPCEVLGRIEKRYDRDFYKFTAKKGDTYIIEAFADRIGSDADVSLRVRNDKGNELAGELDDDNETLHPTSFFNRSTDPAPFKFIAPADGVYTVLVSSIDSNVNFGPRCFYRLRISPPKPDFRAVVMPRSREFPATALVPMEGDTAYDIFLQRRDGFTAPVTVSAIGLPAGVTAKALIIGANSRWGTLVLTGNGELKDAESQIRIELASGDLKQIARPATIVWGVPNQQNTPMIARLEQQLWLVTRREKATFRMVADVSSVSVKTKSKDGKDVEEKPTGPIYVKPGDKITLPLKFTWQGAEPRANPITLSAEATQVNPNNAAVNFNNNQPLTVPKEKSDTPVTLDIRANALPGLQTVVLRAETQIQITRDPAQKDKKTPATVVAYSDPIPVTVLPTAVVKATASFPTNPLRLGKSGDIVVKVERLNDFTGELQVTLTLPKDLKGITLPDKATIPAGKDEVKIPITASADAKPGAINNLPITVTATLYGKHAITHETRINLTVAK
jgi:Bacterial pre-peptidase C-terminal domain